MIFANDDMTWMTATTAIKERKSLKSAPFALMEKRVYQLLDEDRPVFKLCVQIVIQKEIVKKGSDFP